jgi:hypothetical protein
LLSEEFKFLKLIPVATGLLLTTLFLIELLRTLFRWYVAASKVWSYILNGLTASSSAWGDMRLKTSATHKINKLLMNAYRLHRPKELLAGSATGNASHDQTMRNYVLDEERTEPVGGLSWTWSKMIDGTLFDTEGIWINTRLVIIQVAQIGLFCIISIFLLRSVEQIADTSEDARADLDENVPDWVRDLVPTKRAYYAAMMNIVFGRSTHMKFPLFCRIRNGLSGLVSSNIHCHGSHVCAFSYLYPKRRLDNFEVPKSDTSFTWFPTLSGLHESCGLHIHEHSQCYLRPYRVGRTVLFPSWSSPLPLSMAILSEFHGTVTGMGIGVGCHHGTQNDADHGVSESSVQIILPHSTPFCQSFSFGIGMLVHGLRWISTLIQTLAHCDGI